MALLQCPIRHLKIQPGNKAPWGNQCFSSSAQGPNTWERGIAWKAREWLWRRWCMWRWMGGHKAWQWDASSQNKPSLQKEALEWDPIMRKMNPQIGADKIFTDSCPDPDNFYRYMYRQSRKPTQACYLQYMKYQIEMNKPLYHVQFSLLPSEAEPVSSYS